jgi:hypothetical protein
MIGWSIKSCSGLCSRKASGCATGSAHQKLKKSIMDEWKTSKEDGLTLLFPKPLGAVPLALYTRRHNSVCTGSSLCHFGWLGSVMASPLHPCLCRRGGAFTNIHQAMHLGTDQNNPRAVATLGFRMFSQAMDPFPRVVTWNVELKAQLPLRVRDPAMVWLVVLVN